MFVTLEKRGDVSSLAEPQAHNYHEKKKKDRSPEDLVEVIAESRKVMVICKHN